MRQIHLWPEPMVEVDGLITTSMTIELPESTRTRLWYRLPWEYLPSITGSCDSFVIATIFLSMSQGADVRVHGEVSPSLLRNIKEFQAIWSSWRSKDYKIVQITADTEREQPPPSHQERAIATFSGGVNSWVVIWK